MRSHPEVAVLTPDRRRPFGARLSDVSVATAAVALVVWEVVAVLGAVREANAQPPAGWTNAFVAIGVYNLLVCTAVWAVGRNARLSGLHAAELGFRRQVEGEQAVAAERTRIARELHDIVSHAVTVMVLQAAGARRVIAVDQDKASRSLRDIELLGEQAMEELRRMLTALRPDGEDRADRVDAAALTEEGLSDLVGSVSATGVHVELRVSGIVRPLAPSVGLAAYRVVQEALTNVTKHAGPGASVQVRVAWLGEQVEVSVRDDGRGRRPGRSLSAGHGLDGLRERLGIVGAHLEAAPVPGGGFRVVARLPVAGGKRAEAAL